jgi:hypothetical protein
MSPLMMRLFTLVGIALAAASMQLRARADTLPGTQARHAVVAVAGNGSCVAAGTQWRSL